MEMKQNNPETKSDGHPYGFKLFGMDILADGNGMIDMAMRLYLHPDKPMDRETVKFMIDKGQETYYKNYSSDTKLEKGDIILTPAGFMAVSTHGTKTLVSAFTKVLDEEKNSKSLVSLSNRIKEEFMFILGYFWVLWEIERTTGKENVQWTESEADTKKLLEKSIRFVSILLTEIEAHIKEDMR